MTFVNWSLLLALAAALVPVILHLLKRRHTGILDWGAMRFLRLSIAKRRRRVLLEEILLLAIRCVLLALVVLALARPFVSGASRVSWGLLLPGVLLGVLCLAAGAVTGRGAGRWWLWGLGAAVLILAAVGALLEYKLHLAKQTGAPRDVAIIIDTSDSMALGADGRANIERALAEAEIIARTSGRKGSLAIISAGSVERVELAPSTDLEDVLETLGRLKATGGRASLTQAIKLASTTLEGGPNAAKQIVVFSDNQKIAWETADPTRWQELGKSLTSPSIEHTLAARAFPLPTDVTNITLRTVGASRAVVGTDREAMIVVDVANTGNAPVTGGEVQLRVDGQVVGESFVPPLEPGASKSLSVPYRFAQSGSRVIEATTSLTDDLAADNTVRRVGSVTETLPVLIVNGRPADRMLERASAFIQLALDPVLATQRKPGEAKAAAVEKLIDLTVVDAAGTESIGKMTRFRLVILADVPRLPESIAAALVRYVEAGGSLLIAPGPRAVPEFYNSLKRADGNTPFLPATLGKFTALPDSVQPPRPALSTFRHPALRRFRRDSQTDLATAVVRSFWSLKFPAAAEDTCVARLSGGQAFITEHTAGRGRVMMLATSLDTTSGTLPTQTAFPVFVHSLTYHLAASATADLNRSQSQHLTLTLTSRDGRAIASAPGAHFQLTGPGKTSRVVSATYHADTVGLDLGELTQPGIYRVLPPAKLAKTLAHLADDRGSVPVSISYDTTESDFEQAQEADWKVLTSVVGMELLADTDAVRSFAVGKAQGQELSDYVALCALVLLFIEIAIARWIAIRRRIDRSVEVDAAGRVQLEAPGHRPRRALGARP